MENLTAFSLFAIVASITPGPTNFIILSLSSHSLYTTNFTEPLSYQDSAFLKLPKFP